jgi:hypothetical protein
MLPAGRPGFVSRQGRIFVFAQRPYRLWVPPRLLSRGYRVPSSEVKRPEHENNHSPPFSAEVKNAWSYLHSPISLHDVVLSQVPGTTLTVTFLLSSLVLYLVASD